MSTRALVTNDDGVDSVGIRTLAQVAAKAGLDVVVAAPTWDASGASASMTAVADDGRFRFERRSWDDSGVGAVFAVEASPAFIVRASLMGVFGPPPDVVLAGINHGLNTGRAIVHSGTVGAALTASVHDRRAMAVSMDIGSDIHWDTAAQVAGTVLRWLLSAEEPALVNVNVPNVAPTRLDGIRPGRLAPLGTIQATLTEARDGFVRLAYSDPSAPPEPDTDAALLAAGVATFTPLRGVREADSSTFGGAFDV